MHIFKDFNYSEKDMVLGSQKWDIYSGLYQ